MFPIETIVGRPCGQLKGESILYKLSNNPLISNILNLSPTFKALWQAKLAMKFLSLFE
jgi:hypothetical protein